MAKVLKLEQNSRLSRPEFERRYAATPNLKRAELIEGKVYIPNRTSLKHAEQSEAHERFVEELEAKANT